MNISSVSTVPMHDAFPVNQKSTTLKASLQNNVTSKELNTVTNNQDPQPDTTAVTAPIDDGVKDVKEKHGKHKHKHKHQHADKHSMKVLKKGAKMMIKTVKSELKALIKTLDCFDNDGWLDIFIANGKVTSSGSLNDSIQDAYAEQNLLLRGDAAGRFSQIEPAGGTTEQIIKTSRAAVFGDIDNDGAIDILVVNKDSKVSLLHNIAPNKGNWIMFKVVDDHNRDAIGATVQISVGDRTISREVRTSYSYCASNDPRVHFGLGLIYQVTDVSVRWPDGTVESFGQFNTNQITTLQRGSGTSTIND